jgi:hypothetical protein
MKAPVSKVFVAFEFWEHPASKRSTTLLIWPLLSAMFQSPSSLSSMSKAYGLSRKSVFSWMRFQEMARSVPMQSCNPTCHCPGPALRRKVHEQSFGEASWDSILRGDTANYPWHVPPRYAGRDGPSASPHDSGADGINENRFPCDKGLRPAALRRAQTAAVSVVTFPLLKTSFYDQT